MRLLRIAAFIIFVSIQTHVQAFSIVNDLFPWGTPAATYSEEEHFRRGCFAMQTRRWDEACNQFAIVSANFPNSSFGISSLYFLGVSYYSIGEYDLANEAFSKYLHCQTGTEYFESAVEYKLSIANHFNDGARRRFFGMKYLPQWLPADEMALEIYDEVCSTLPCHEFATSALYGKGELLWKQGFYPEAIDTYQQLIRRFPKHELAPECYLAISYIYLDQCRQELHNADLLPFAQINLKRFQEDFPREERICKVEANLLAMEELYASSLYDTGQYYERKGRPLASLIYYRNALSRFPKTCIAHQCESRIAILQCQET